METKVFLILLLSLKFERSLMGFLTPVSKIFRNVNFKAGPCHKNQGKFPFIYEKQYIKVIGGVDKIFINLKHEVLEDLYVPFKIVNTVYRCSLTNRNNCERLASFTLPDVCAMRENFQVLADIILGPLMAIEPKIDCANGTEWKGTYWLRNYTLDMQAAKILPIGGYLWRLEDVRSFGRYEDLLCITIDAVVRDVIPRS